MIDNSIPCDSFDPYVIVVSLSDVEALDITSTLEVLKQLIKSPTTSRHFVEKVDIAFEGYDHTSEELFEIQEVREFVHELDEQFPYWLFFLSKYFYGLQCILLCHLPPFLTEEAKSRTFPEEIGELLTKRWFPAMNHICEYAGFIERQIERLTENAVKYITEGRFSPEDDLFS